jgi:hypothetical protein
MPTDQLEIGNGSEANLEIVRQAKVQRSEPDWQLIDRIIRLGMKTLRD